MPKAEMLRYSVISATGEPDAFKRCMSGSERGGWKRTRKGNALAALYVTIVLASLTEVSAGTFPAEMSLPEKGYGRLTA